MASQTNSAVETSGTNVTAGSNLHLVNQDEPSPHFVEKLLKDHDWKNEEFSKLSVKYFYHNQNAINYAKAVKKHFNSFQSFIQFQDVNWEAALNICDGQFFNDLDGVYVQQVQMKENLQSFRDNLSQNLQHAKFWKMFYAVGFTVAVTAFAKKKSIAAAAVVTLLDLLALALTFLPGPFWDWTFSLLNKCDDGMKKYLEITGSMASGAQITAGVVSRLGSSARQFQTQTRSILETAESSDAGEERKKLVESFQELQEIAAVLCQDTHSARKCSFDTVKNHIWIP